MYSYLRINLISKYQLVTIVIYKKQRTSLVNTLKYRINLPSSKSIKS